MSTETEQAAPDPETTDVVEQPVAQPAPAPDYAAELAALRAEQAQARQENAATLNMIREGFTMLASSQRPTDPGIPDVSDDFVEQQMAEGKGAAAIRQVVRAETARATAALKRDAVDPLATLVQTHGIGAIAALARQQAEQGTDPVLRPYVARHRQEIDQAIESMLPEYRLRAEHIQVAQGAVLTRHLPGIIEEERQKVIRQLRDNPGSVPGAAVGRQGRDTGPAVPTADELFGKGSTEAKMIRQAGGEDAYIAKHASGKYASKTWSEYVGKYQAMTGQTPEGNA